MDNTDDTMTPADHQHAQETAAQDAHYADELPAPEQPPIRLEAFAELVEQIADAIRDHAPAIIIALTDRIRVLEDALGAEPHSELSGLWSPVEVRKLRYQHAQEIEQLRADNLDLIARLERATDAQAAALADAMSSALPDVMSSALADAIEREWYDRPSVPHPARMVGQDRTDLEYGDQLRNP